MASKVYVQRGTKKNKEYPSKLFEPYGTTTYAYLSKSLKSEYKAAEASKLLGLSRDHQVCKDLRHLRPARLVNGTSKVAEVLA